VWNRAARFVNGLQPALHADYEDWLEELAPGAHQPLPPRRNRSASASQSNLYGCNCPQLSSPGKMLLYLTLERGSAIISATVSRQVW
jgi:hypothetical protein